MEYHTNMFKDGNIPDCYRYHYERTTGANTRFVTRPVESLTRWESQAISAKLLLDEINKKYNI